jgi:CheY-like chemotaxis protein
MEGRIVARAPVGEARPSRSPCRWQRDRDVRLPRRPWRAVEGACATGEIRVLAAEDNDVNQLVLKTLLNQAGSHPTMVADGALALGAWERETWDVILMDIQMPRWTASRRPARSAARGDHRPRHGHRSSRSPPSHGPPGREYNAAGMDGLVSKPIELERLFGAIDALAIRRRLCAKCGRELSHCAVRNHNPRRSSSHVSIHPHSARELAQMLVRRQPTRGQNRNGGVMRSMAASPSVEPSGGAGCLSEPSPCAAHRGRVAPERGQAAQ